MVTQGVTVMVRIGYEVQAHISPSSSGAEPKLILPSHDQSGKSRDSHKVSEKVKQC